MKWFNRTILILTPIMVLTSSIAFAASPVRRPVLYFNPLETRQNKGDNAWKNAGTAGGEIQKGEAKPILEMGSPLKFHQSVFRRTMPRGIPRLGLRQFLPTKWMTLKHLLLILKTSPLGSLCG